MFIDASSVKVRHMIKLSVNTRGDRLYPVRDVIHGGPITSPSFNLSFRDAYDTNVTLPTSGFHYFYLFQNMFLRFASSRCLVQLFVHLIFHLLIKIYLYLFSFLSLQLSSLIKLFYFSYLVVLLDLLKIISLFLLTMSHVPL